MERRGFIVRVELSGIDVDNMLWHSIYEARSYGYLIRYSTIQTSIAILIITARGWSLRGHGNSRFIYQTKKYPSGFHRIRRQRKKTQCAVALIPRMPFAMLRIIQEDVR